MPMDSDMPEFWKVDRMPGRRAAVLRGDAGHDGGGVRRGEQAGADAVAEDEQRERQ